jgi:hypothetical protein
MNLVAIHSLLQRYPHSQWRALLRPLVDAGFVNLADAEQFLRQEGLPPMLTSAEFKALVARNETPEVVHEQRSPAGSEMQEPEIIPKDRLSRRIFELTPGEEETFLRFTAVLDERTTNVCRSLDGTMLPAGDPFWTDHSPPCHAGDCRSMLLAFDGRTAAKIGITSVPEPGTYIRPETGWGLRESRYPVFHAEQRDVRAAVARAKRANPLW